MTKKDYELIADVFNHEITWLHYAGQSKIINEKRRYALKIAVIHLQMTVDILADKLKQDNHLFDKDKFLNASGVLNNTSDPESASYIV